MRAGRGGLCFNCWLAMFTVPAASNEWHRRRCCLEAYATAAFYFQGAEPLLAFNCDKHGEIAVPSKEPYETPILEHMGRVPSLRLHLVASLRRPGELSLRVEADDESWGPVFEALNAAGFKAGDVVQLTKVPQ